MGVADPCVAPSPRGYARPAASQQPGGARPRRFSVHLPIFMPTRFVPSANQITRPPMRYSSSTKTRLSAKCSVQQQTERVHARAHVEHRRARKPEGDTDPVGEEAEEAGPAAEIVVSER